jgi:hypothetical protein
MDGSWAVPFAEALTSSSSSLTSLHFRAGYGSSEILQNLPKTRLSNLTLGSSAFSDSPDSVKALPLCSHLLSLNIVSDTNFMTEETFAAFLAVLPDTSLTSLSFVTLFTPSSFASLLSTLTKTPKLKVLNLSKCLNLANSCDFSPSAGNGDGDDEKKKKLSSDQPQQQQQQQTTKPLTLSFINSLFSSQLEHLSMDLIGFSSSQVKSLLGQRQQLHLQHLRFKQQQRSSSSSSEHTEDDRDRVLKILNHLLRCPSGGKPGYYLFSKRL